MSILKELKRKQRENKLTNKGMADLFGIHEITWAKIKAGTIPLSDKMKCKAIQIYPDLMPIFLSENARKVAKRS